MKWQTIIVGLIALPVLALFGGSGFLAYQIGQSWDARSTDALIAGLVATCGGGVVVIGILLALIVGIPFAIRIFGEAGYSQRTWRDPSPPPPTPFIPGKESGAIDAAWRALPQQPAAPPWGMTGGGHAQLLPAPQQDDRFRMTDNQAADPAEIAHAWGE